MIILSQPGFDWPPAGGRLSAAAPKLCLPMYSFHESDGEQFRARVKAHEYPWWVYLPGSKQYKLVEGFLRLDAAQLVESSHLRPIECALTEDARYFVSEWFRFYVSGEIDPTWVEYRRELLAEQGYTGADNGNS